MSLDFRRPGATDYLAVLNGLLIFHTAVAKFSRGTVARELGQDIAVLVRVQSLRTDIRLMSERPQAWGRSGTGACGTWPDSFALADQLRGGREERIGAAYVAAGSALGGRVIAASLANSSSDFPRSFFASEGIELGRLWRRFRIALDAFGESGADSDRVIAGALTAFTFISEILSSPDAALTVAT